MKTDNHTHYSIRSAGSSTIFQFFTAFMVKLTIMFTPTLKEEAFVVGRFIARYINKV